MLILGIISFRNKLVKSECQLTWPSILTLVISQSPNKGITFWERRQTLYLPEGAATPPFFHCHFNLRDFLVDFCKDVMNLGVFLFEPDMHPLRAKVADELLDPGGLAPGLLPVYT